MQKIAELFLGHFLDCVPEPFNDLMVLIICSFIFRIQLPVLDIDKGNTIKNHLELVRFEDRQERLWYYFVEALLNHFDVF